MFLSTILAVSSSLAFLSSGCLAATTVVVSGTASHSIPSTLYGQMFEESFSDISSGDGGLYAELLQNRAFQQVTPNTTAALLGWNSIYSTINVVADPSPISSALPNSLQLTIPANTAGAVGFGNEGYFGIKVDASWTYRASFYYKFPSASSFSGNLTVALQSSTTPAQTYASTSLPITASTSWTLVNVTLNPSSSAPTTANNFTVTLQGSAEEDTAINFAMFSLFPPTFNGRPNGMRIDIAETLAAMRPSFFRLPGGNNLGQSTATRWQWNNTVGPLVDRPGRLGDWGYINTDGLGLMEYLEWCEDLNMEPIMAVWAGYSLDGTSLLEDELAPYIQQAIDQVNFVVGDPASSTPAALRASLGHPEPFNLTYVEIGNEDFFASTSYIYRWRDFAGNLTAAFPNLKFIATSYVSGPVLYPTPLQYDVHVYETPSWFADNAFYYDSFERNGTRYFEGEYAAISTNASDLYGTPADGRLLYPTVESSVNEAAFMTGLERNSDIVFAASYAPLLQNIASSSWTPNLVNFDAATVYPSTSFYVQQLFSLNRGDEYLPSTLPTINGTLYWSVTRNTTEQQIYVKIANTASTADVITFELPFGTVATTGTAQVLTGAANASDTPTTPNAVMPMTQTITTGRTFEYTAPALSVSVLTVGAY